MSSSIAIPKRSNVVVVATGGSVGGSSSPGNSSSYGSPGSYGASHGLSEKRKSKLPVGVVVPGSSPSPSSSPSSASSEWMSPRRPSLLGSSLSKSEYTVVNLGHSDGPPRLVTCVKSSQGFDWNQELFLPSYAHYDNHDLEHRPDPVEEIVLTDEEAASILPQ